MREVFRNIYHFVLKHLPTKLVLNIENIFVYKRLLPNKPMYFGEKVQWLKLNGNLEKYNDYVDKYKVRNYIETVIGNEYLLPLISVYDKPEDINYDELPNSFVLKVNHGSGYNIIVKDKKNIDYNKTNKKLKKWLNEDYSAIKKEFQYKNVERKIICEQFVNDKAGHLLDYKFFCFDGEPKMIEVDFDRFSGHKMNFYDLKWNLLDLKKGTCDNYKENYPKPKNFKKMIDIVRKLSKEFQFVRVDLYNVDGKIYFGELTFTPASGRHPFKPLKKDIEIAKNIVTYENERKN